MKELPILLLIQEKLIQEKIDILEKLAAINRAANFKFSRQYKHQLKNRLKNLCYCGGALGVKGKMCPKCQKNRQEQYQKKKMNGAEM